MVSLDFALGRPREAIDWSCCAVCLRVAYFCLLRPGEHLSLRFSDLRFTADDDGALVVMIAIRHPKNRRAYGTQQLVISKDLPIILWLAWLAKSIPSAARIWPSTRSRLSSCLACALKSLAVPRGLLTLGSLRPGRATQLFISGVDLMRVKLQGDGLVNPA